MNHLRHPVPVPRIPEGGETPFAPGEEPVYDEHSNIVAVSYTPPDAEDAEAFWTDQRFAEMQARIQAANTLGPSLVGLPVAEAQRIVDQRPGLTIQFRHGSTRWPPIGVAGQIDAIVQDGVVVKIV